MVAMTYGGSRAAAGASKAKAKQKAKTSGFFARLLTAMMDARLRQAQRELELHRHLIRSDDAPLRFR